MQRLVLDTNIVLDLFVFGDPRVLPLHEALRGRAARWLATEAMREELARVLGYPHIAARMALRTVQAVAVLDGFARHAELVPEAPRAPFACKDPDDQKFIDLAVAHQGLLLSKDGEVLRMRKRLARLGVDTRAAWDGDAPAAAQAVPRAM